MARLPIPGEDAGAWGDILNEFLEVSHHSDGSLRNINLDLITNVDAGNPQDGDVLAYDDVSSTWLASTPVVTESLSDLNDVDISNPQPGELLQYDGGSWTQIDPPAAVPAGAVQAFLMDSAPDGWLKANGVEVSRTTYSDLFNAIGTSYGAGDGSTTFNLPDLRGEFLRGWDDGRGIDNERNLGSEQNESIIGHAHGGGSYSADAAGSHGHSASSNSTGSHGHGINARQFETTAASGSARRAGGSWKSNELSANSNGNHSHSISVGTGGGHAHSVSGTSGNTGGDETRPRNISVLYCVKY